MEEIKQLLDKLEIAIRDRQKATVKSLIEKFEFVDVGDEIIPQSLNQRAERLFEKAQNLLNG